jgi:hypothetical protein
LTDVHVIYRRHEGNSSGSAEAIDYRRLRLICEERIKGLERLRKELRLTSRQMRAMNRNLARAYFWHLGYSCCWQAHDRAGALIAMRAGLKLTPFDGSMMKTYALCAARTTIRSLFVTRT